jgi:hypothetical protein
LRRDLSAYPMRENPGTTALSSAALKMDAIVEHYASNLLEALV